MESHGVVGRDDAFLLDAEHVLPLRHLDGDEGRSGLLGRDGESLVVVGDEGLREEAVGVIDARQIGSAS